MSFEDLLYEGVIYTPKIQKVRKTLKDLLIQPQTIMKIKIEIENGWRMHGRVASNTITDAIASTLKSVYGIGFIYDYNLKASAQFNYDDDGEHVVYANPDNIAKMNEFYVMLTETGTAKKTRDFIVHFINIIVHELIHFYQADSRADKLDPDEMFYKETRSDKKYKSENWRYYYLNDKDEMMAFAAEIIGDLKDRGYKQKDILNFISQDQETISVGLNNYRKFNKEIKLPNWNTFLGYLYKYATEYYREI